MTHSDDFIRVHGARENNLKNINVETPKRALTVFTGVSGSGKCSLVFATIAGESQRLMNKTYSAFVQGFMPRPPRPDVDVLGGLTTAITSISKQRMVANPRTTVGTATAPTRTRCCASCSDGLDSRTSARPRSQAFSFYCCACLMNASAVRSDRSRAAAITRALMRGSTWAEEHRSETAEVMRPLMTIPAQREITQEDMEAALAMQAFVPMAEGARPILVNQFDQYLTYGLPVDTPIDAATLVNRIFMPVTDELRTA
jgi:energy-coupling factor transporter ATP-binding protein EcfA2